MALGPSTANLANKWLDSLTNTSFASGTSTLYIAFHTGDPGASGTANASAWTTRASATFGAAGGGVKSLSNTPTTGAVSLGVSETWTHVSVWTASTAGTFLFSGALSASKTMNNGDTFNLSSMTLQFSPVAA